MRAFIATLAFASAFLLVLFGLTSRPARADHCPDWAASCAHPWAGQRIVPRVHRDARGLPGPLAAAITNVQRQCPGFRVISAFRRGARVRGSGRPSLHASGRAADIAGGEFGCAYRVLAGFAGGMTTDAHRVRPNHIHLSWAPGGAEFGRRFAHRGGSRAGRARVHLARR